MIARFLANFVAMTHFGVVMFIILGGLLVLRWPGLIWVHLPLAIWGVVIELFDWSCPLTPLENYLRKLGGSEGYSGGFVDHYIFPLLYPDGMSRKMQYVVGAIVLVINFAIYTRLFTRGR